MLNRIGLTTQYLESMAPILPLPIYWLDRNGFILGANEAILKAFGYKAITQLLGKNYYDLHSNKESKCIIVHHQQVMKEERALQQEESITDISTGQIRYYQAMKMPLRDEKENIIGLICIAMEITAQKENERLRLEEIKKINIIKYLNILASSFPLPIYWNDLDSTILGYNEYAMKVTGAKSTHQFIGKSIYDLYPKRMAENIIRHNIQVIEAGQTLSQEEEILDISTGKPKYFMAYKSPLRDEDGKIIGTLGTSIDITAEKITNQLKLENDIQKNVLQEQEKFRKIADKVAHDIRSPLASMLMIVKDCQAIPERERIALREVATTINDIANNLLNIYAKIENNHNSITTKEERETILISPIILQILTDKKYQYQNYNIKFNHHFSQTGNFSWIKIEQTAFKRMLSNIINNAVDASEKKEGKISLYLDADDEQVIITIKDSGKGMKPELVQKILSNISVTEGKEEGHGIGLTQVYETLQNNQGKWFINSQVGIGTEIILTYPRVQSEIWIAEKIQLNNDDIIVILDDDNSIHLAWDTRLDTFLKELPNLTVKHFKNGQDVIDFINRLTPDQKNKIFLLTDYELLKQDLNGLSVIKKTSIDRSILVTSYYADKSIRNSINEMGKKILPKQLAFDVPIKILHVRPHEDQIEINTQKKNATIVFVDDSELLLNSLTLLALDKEIDTYSHPQHFLDRVSCYSKDTKIVLDYNFSNFEKTGVQIAERLYSLGFTEIYLFSGRNLFTHEIPSYLKIIPKSDIEKIASILDN